MNNRLHILICTLLLLLCSVLQAQPTPPAPPEPVKMSFDKDGVSMIINRKDAGLSEDSILRDLGFVSGVSLDLLAGGRKRFNWKRWLGVGETQFNHHYSGKIFSQVC